MTKLKLLATTAIFIGAVSVSSMAQAEDTSWVNTLKQSVTGWFQSSEDTTTNNVDEYLDEVSIAVPPMTADEAADIQPAAGDYQETLEQAMENTDMDFQELEQVNIPGADNYAPTNLVDIEPAAGDAEEIVDESVVVVEKAHDDAMDHAEEAMDEAHEHAEEAKDHTEEAIEDAHEHAEETMEDAHEAAEDMHNDVMDKGHDMMGH